MSLCYWPRSGSQRSRRSRAATRCSPAAASTTSDWYSTVCSLETAATTATTVTEARPTPTRSEMQLNLKVLMFLVLTVGITTCIAAQQTESLLIGPGDLVQIHVLDTPDLDQAVR